MILEEDEAVFDVADIVDVCTGGEHVPSTLDKELGLPQWYA